MKFIKILTLLLTVIAISACVSLPPIQDPIELTDNSRYSLFRDASLDQTNHIQQHLDDDGNIIYIQNYGGGGAGLGVLAGPLGVAANMKMIESNTMKDVALIKNKIDIDPVSLFEASAKAAGLSEEVEATSPISVSPYLLAVKTEGEIIKLGAAIIYKDENKPYKFPTKYLLQLPFSYSTEELGNITEPELQDLKESVANAYNELVTFMLNENLHDVTNEAEIKLKSEFLTPRFKFEMQGRLVAEKDDMVWVRIIGCTCGVFKEDIDFSFNKRKK